MLPNTSLPNEPWPGPTHTDRPTLKDLLERAKRDTALMQSLKAQPLQTCLEWGVGVNTRSVKHWLGYNPDTLSDEALVDLLLARTADGQCSG